MNITTAKKEKKEMGARNLLLLIFITFIALGNPILAQQANQEQAAVQAVDYKIGAKDLLEIKVFELPELNQTVRVAEDGTVSLAVIGKVDVSGLTAGIRKEISLDSRSKIYSRCSCYRFCQRASKNIRPGSGGKTRAV